MRNPFKALWERMTDKVWAEGFAIGYEIAQRTSTTATTQAAKDAQIRDLAKHAAEEKRTA